MQKFRALAFIAVGKELERAMMMHTSKIPDGATPSCLSCEHFYEPTEVCRISNDNRPPARIIAFGCHQYKDKDSIPF